MDSSTLGGPGSTRGRPGGAPGGPGSPRGRLVLLLGGARSGKSDHAERLAKADGRPVTFVATAEARDRDMADRIARHRQDRPEGWATVECPRSLGPVLRDLDGPGVIIIDCLTLLVTNVLLGAGADEPEDYTAAEAAVRAEVEALSGAAQAARDAGSLVLVVSNEVGLGLVPSYPLGRLYRDVLGRANQALAAVSDEVYLMVAGIPVTVK